MRTGLILFVAFVVGVLIVNSVSAQTYVWKKYDDFNSGVIDTNKWDIDNSSAAISIENGKAKFVHNPGFPGDSAWLKIKKKQTNVRGIKATIQFESCTFADPANRDVRARVGANIGAEATTPTNRVFSSLGLEPYYNNGDSPRLYGFINVWDTNVSPDVIIADRFYGYFPREAGEVAADVIGIPFTITEQWTAKSVKFMIASEGTATYNFDKTYKIKPYTDPTKALVGIGTVSNSGAGTCTVYFDDVWVLRLVP
jgi:hypothetical protein